MTAADRRLADAASERAGTFDRRTALSAGLSDRRLQGRVRAGAVDRLANGRFAVAGAPRTWMLELHAAALGLGPEQPGGISHAAAAALWGLPGYDEGPVELLVPVGVGTRNPLAVVHRSRNLRGSDFTRRRELPVTTVERTLVDLASVEADRRRFLSAFDDAICRRITTIERIEATAARVIRGSRPGRGLIDAGLSCWGGGAIADNFSEMAIVRLLVEAGLPEPQRQYRIHDAQGRFIARVDCAYPWAKVVIEVESERWHGGTRSVTRDVRRELELQAAGWTLRRVTPAEIRNGAGLFLAAVRKALEPHLASGPQPRHRPAS